MPRPRRRSTSPGALAVALVLACLVGPSVAGQEDGTSWSVQDCAACHDELAAKFARNPHSVLDREPDRRPEGYGSSCTSCHGDTTRHLEEAGEPGTIFHFGEDAPTAVKIDTCLRCHRDAHPRFERSPHGKAGMDCTSCHAIHAGTGEPPLLKTAEGPRDWPSQTLGVRSALCVECHTDVLTQFQFNEHHRLQEGILSCTSCHDPHEPPTRWQLGGFKRSLCIDCHRDKGGPFVFEHGSVKVEGCVACHTPHGSPNRHLLAFQSVGELCFSCHAAVPGFHAAFTVETATRASTARTSTSTS
jgi:DmsE family decaheme c-type cytochrome